MNTTTNEIEQLHEILPLLAKTDLHELRDFAAYLIDRKRRRKELVERVLKAEKEPDTVTCHSAEEFIQAIENAKDDD